MDIRSTISIFYLALFAVISFVGLSPANAMTYTYDVNYALSSGTVTASSVPAPTLTVGRSPVIILTMAYHVRSCLRNELGVWL